MNFICVALYLYNIIYIYIANLDFDDLTVAALAALAPPTNNDDRVSQSKGWANWTKLTPINTFGGTS